MLLYWVALALVALDQASKYLILRGFSLGESLAVVPGIFNLTFVRNTGIAFSLFERHPAVLTGVILLCVIGLLIYSRVMTQKTSFEKITYGLILGGALGNLIDRFRFGSVVDFLDFRIWPVFNIADSAITVGVTLLAIKILFYHENTRRDPA